jgi:membrane protease YdiL (CAAX protease family)
VLSVVLLFFLKKNGLFEEYGLCRSKISAKKMLFYLPLVALLTANVWNGVTLNYQPLETVLYILAMFCVGFLEELIFRGFLFKAMSRDNVRSAIIVSSITFGIGHILNLFNGSGADLVSNLCQVCYAMVMGFLFVIIFHRGGSLLPCILVHSTINGLSVFADESKITNKNEIVTTILLIVVSVMYIWVLLKTLPETKEEK